MSANHIHEIIGKIVVDDDYRKLFFKDSAKALVGYPLSQAERETLSGMADCPGCRLGTLIVNKRFHFYEQAGAAPESVA